MLEPTPRSRRRLRPHFPEVLSDAPFRSLLLSQGIFDIGITMRLAAQSWVVFELTGSQLWVGLAAGVRAIPVILFAVATGVLADRFSRRLLLSISMVWMATLVAVTAVITVAGVAEAWHYVALAFGVGIGAALHGPSFFALFASLVPRERLGKANGMVSFVAMSGEMVGPLLTGIVIAASGAGAVFWIVTAGYLSGAMLMLRVREPRRAAPAGGASLAGLRQGLVYVRQTQPLPWLILLVMLQNLLAVAIFPLMPVYAKEVLDVGAQGFGVMGGVLGAGLLGSAAIVTVFGTHHRRAMVMLATGLVWDACMVGFGFSRSYPLSLALLFTMGLSGVVWVNAALTMFQNAATEEMRGRVMALYVLSMDMFPLGWLFGGAMAAWLGNEEALVISALGGTPVMLIALLLSPALRRA
ncbi:MAG: MFS transporter [Chloroflexi bacterium]|nr:MFS transporter [Chloroflexota bacterium]MDA1296850.1 MFS transporter [Chloroflexota bacterium]